MDTNRYEIAVLEGEPVYEYVLDNGKIQVHIMNLGGAVTEILVPNKNGQAENVVLKYKHIANYIKASPAYFGSLVGRTAGRVPKGLLKVGDKRYQLDLNNNGNTLHGGTKCFSTKVWQTESFTDTSLTLKYHSADGEQGYPGNLDVIVEYALDKDNSLSITYHAVSDMDTAVNMTNHMYFNLSGDAKETVKTNKLFLGVSGVLETDENMIATGQVVPVEGTEFDFTTAKLVGQDRDGDYDCCFILNKDDNAKVVLEHENSGRKLEIHTDQPALVLYTDCSNSDEILSINRTHSKNDGICFEPQYPNIGANGNFEDSYFLKAGDEYNQKTVYKFSF